MIKHKEKKLKPFSYKFFVNEYMGYQRKTLYSPTDIEVVQKINEIIKVLNSIKK